MIAAARRFTSVRLMGEYLWQVLNDTKSARSVVEKRKLKLAATSFFLEV